MNSLGVAICVYFFQFSFLRFRLAIVTSPRLSSRLLPMDESEKRRERLKAMRREAAEAAAAAYTDEGAMRNESQGLSNPMIAESETASTTSTQRRFDYYTDPMAAFSGSRKRDDNAPHHNPQGHHYAPRMPYYPPPPYRAPMINSPTQRIFEAPPHYNQGPFQQPFNRPEANFQIPWTNFPRGSNYTSPRFGPVRAPGQHYNNYNPGPGLGRGSTRPPGPGLGSSGVRGRSGGSHESVSAEPRSHLYYRKEMVEDPWRSLTPVLWSGVVRGSGSGGSWLPNSIRPKRAKVDCDEGSQKTVVKGNLAEFLSECFDDEVDEDVDGERGM